MIDVLLVVVLMFSLVFSFVAIIYLSLIRNLRTVSNRLLLYLTTADFLGVLFWIINSYPSSNPNVCPIIPALSDYFGKLAGFCTCLVGFHLLWKMTGHKLYRFQELLYVLFVVGLPVIPEAIQARDMQAYSGGGCWFTSKEGHYAYGLTKLFVFVLNAILFGSVLRNVRASGDKWGMHMKSKERMLVVIQLWYLIYTIPGLIILLPNPSANLTTASSVLAAFQGLINSIVVMWKPFATAIKKWRKSISSDDEDKNNTLASHGVPVP